MITEFTVLTVLVFTIIVTAYVMAEEAMDKELDEYWGNDHD